MTQQQFENKLALVKAALIMVGPMPAGTTGSPPPAYMTLLEGAYQTLNQTIMPDETVFTSPTITQGAPHPASPQGPAPLTPPSSTAAGS